MSESSDILWLKVSDEVGLPTRLSKEEEARLLSIFDPENSSSPWSKALARLGIDMPRKAPGVLRFVNGVPYFNGSLLAELSSQGTVAPVRHSDGGLSYTSHLGFFGLFRLLRAQSRLEFFFRSPKGCMDPLEESIALGLAIQALMQRLGSRSEAETARWLASPSSAPSSQRRTLQRVLSLQKRRNELSAAWRALFPSRIEDSNTEPPFFWNEPPDRRLEPEKPQEDCLGRWIKGIPIVPGKVEGTLLLVDKNTTPPFNGETSPILLFPKARPESIEFFPHAAAVIYAEGGALSHACSIAREQGIICVSGLGRGLVSAAQRWKEKGLKIRVEIDGEKGEIICRECPI